MVGKHQNNRQSGRADGKRSIPLLLQLFLSTLMLSAFTFGGGYVIITLMQKKFVEEYGWVDREEMLDLVAIAQSAPGPIAVNGAIVIGYKLARVPGLLVAVLGTVLPPFAILSLVSLFYAAFRSNPIVALALSGMQAGVSAVIASVVYDMGLGVVRGKQWLDDVLMVIVFALNFLLGVNAAFLILGCALLGLVRGRLPGLKKEG